MVAGPTAVGKTEACIKLARRYDTGIVSADSRQFYKEMNIGTAKPSIEELAAAPHYLIDHLSIHDPYTVKDFEKDALGAIAEIHSKSPIAILAGGSGLYVQAICSGLDEIPDVPAQFRSKLTEELKIHGLSFLLQELKEKDPEYYAVVDKANPQRVVRALEVIRSTGSPFSSFRTRKEVERPFSILKIGLKRERESLYKRIEERMDTMIQSGLFEEAQSLFQFRHLNALQTVGYTEIFRHLENEYDYDEAVRLLKRNSRRYAKRQMTWFNKHGFFDWFVPEDISEIIRFIDENMDKLQEK